MFRRYPHHRKYKFIDRKQQLRFAVDVALHSLLFPAFFMIMMIVPPFSSFFLAKNADTARPVLLDFLRISLDHWWVIVVSLLFVGVFSVLFSHRIFGPIRRFENALRAKQKDPQQPVRCSLRTADYFHEYSLLLENTLNLDAQPQDSEMPAKIAGA